MPLFRFLEITLDFGYLRSRHSEVSDEVTRQEPYETLGDERSCGLCCTSDLISETQIPRNWSCFSNLKDDVRQFSTPLPCDQVSESLRWSHVRM